MSDRIPWGHPGDQTACPECARTFADPDLREVAGGPALLDYHCPHCGYHYARWPKTLRVPPGPRAGDRP